MKQNYFTKTFTRFGRSMTLSGIAVFLFLTLGTTVYATDSILNVSDVFANVQNQVTDRSVVAENGYRLEKVRSDQIDKEMKIANTDNDVFDSLKGLWWMDGNPLPDKIVSLAGSNFNPQTRTLLIKVYDQDIWSWHGNNAGRLSYNFANRVKLEYQIQFNESLTFGAVTPFMTIGGVRRTIPENVVKFTVRYSKDGLWIRDSSFAGSNKVYSYQFRRIVNKNGTREAAFDDYVKAAPVYSYLSKRTP